MTAQSIEQGVEELQLSSWKEFVEHVRVEHARREAWVYRGQADASWPVRSSLDRLIERSPNRVLYGASGRDTESTVPPTTPERHLHAFKDAARGRMVGEKPRDEGEWWALGQQHGLCTPLLDFTASPFVALYFAFEERYCQDENGSSYEPANRAVFGIPFFISEFFDKQAKSPAIKAIRPVGEGSYRLPSQAGLFVQLPPGSDLESVMREHFARESTDENRHARGLLTKIVVRNEDREGCLRFLARMNISRLSLFPDLDGSAAHINRLWELNFDTDLGMHYQLYESETSKSRRK